MGYIAGIGGANMDIHGKSDRQLIMRDSNPGSLHTSLGGVCRNICENLARLGETVRLITVVGDDVQGRGIIEGCEKAGIDMSATRVLRGERSSSYISIMDGDGDMLLAMSDMHIIKQLNAQLVDESRDLLCGADLVVCARQFVRQDHRAAVSDLRQAAVSGSRFHGMGAGTQAVYRLL